MKTPICSLCSLIVRGSFENHFNCIIYLVHDGKLSKWGVRTSSWNLVYVFGFDFCTCKYSLSSWGRSFALSHVQMKCLLLHPAHWISLWLQSTWGIKQEQRDTAKRVLTLAKQFFFNMGLESVSVYVYCIATKANNFDMNGFFFIRAKRVHFCPNINNFTTNLRGNFLKGILRGQIS